MCSEESKFIPNCDAEAASFVAGESHKHATLRSVKNSALLEDSYILLVLKQSSCKVDNCFNFVGTWSEVRRQGLIYLTNHGRESLLSDCYFGDVSSSCRSSHSIDGIFRQPTAGVRREARFSEPLSDLSTVVNTIVRRSDPIAASFQSHVSSEKQTDASSQITCNLDLFKYSSSDCDDTIIKRHSDPIFASPGQSLMTSEKQTDVLSQTMPDRGPFMCYSINCADSIVQQSSEAIFASPGQSLMTSEKPTDASPQITSDRDLFKYSSSDCDDTIRKRRSDSISASPGQSRVSLKKSTDVLSQTVYDRDSFKYSSNVSADNIVTHHSEPISASPVSFDSLVPPEKHTDASSQIICDYDFFKCSSGTSKTSRPSAILVGPQAAFEVLAGRHSSNSDSDIPCAQSHIYHSSSPEKTDSSFVLDKDEVSESVKVTTNIENCLLVFALKDHFYYPGMLEPSSRSDMHYILFDDESKAFVEKPQVLFIDFPPVGTIIQADARIDGHYLAYQEIVQHLPNQQSCVLRNSLTHEELIVPRSRLRLTEEMVQNVKMVLNSSKVLEVCKTPIIFDVSTNNIMSGKRIRREKTLRDSWVPTPPPKNRRHNTPISSAKKIRLGFKSLDNQL